MANALVIYNGPGPLPQSANFNAPSDGSVVFILSGTTRTASAPNMTGISLSLDGTVIGAAMCWANQNDNHIAMATTFIPYKNLSFGQHTIELTYANGNTITDVNDRIQVTLLY